MQATVQGLILAFFLMGPQQVKQSPVCIISLLHGVGVGACGAFLGGTLFCLLVFELLVFLEGFL